MPKKKDPPPVDTTDEKPVPATDVPAGDTNAPPGEPPSHRPYFEAVRDGDAWTWVLWSSNGTPMAVSGLSYKRMNDLTTAVKTFVRTVPHASRIITGESITPPGTAEEDE